ncbi:MAG TPA: hypothetical protein VHI13_10980 [Candidatus Kapabacteria bacterium]|nr:hypothetical protein [Candidatus Kapabacteria bacterium]
MSDSSISLNNRWLRLMQPGLYPYDPTKLIGGEVKVDPEISQMNDLIRLVEICSSSPFMAFPVLNRDPHLASATGGYWKDNVTTWNAAQPEVLNAPPKWGTWYNQYRFRDGLVVAPLKITLGLTDLQGEGDAAPAARTAARTAAREAAQRASPGSPELEGYVEPLSIWNYLIIDREGKHIDRLDPHPGLKAGLDTAIKAFIKGQPDLADMTYRTPEETGTVYRELVRTTVISWDCPEFVHYNMWAYWLLYARLFFSDETQEQVYSTIASGFAGGYPAVNVLLNFYADFTVNGILHTLSDVAFFQKYPSRNDLWRYEPALMDRIYVTTTGQLRTSQINQVIGAALREYITVNGGRDYAAKYNQYMGVNPRYVPVCQDCGTWIPSGQVDAALRGILEGKVLRFGYLDSEPFVYEDGGVRTGFEYDIAVWITSRLNVYYSSITKGGLTIGWANMTPPGGADDMTETEKFLLLYNGMAQGAFHVAIGGRLMLAGDQLPAGTNPEWICPTAFVFTAISYTGRAIGTFAPDWTQVMTEGDRAAFVRYVAGTLLTKGVDLTFFSVINPGPSPGSAQDLVAEINNARGKDANASAVWVNGTVDQTAEVIGGQRYHFVVGDSTATGHQFKKLAPHNGMYLNIAAVERPSLYNNPAVRSVTLLPIAPYTINAR